MKKVGKNKNEFDAQNKNLFTFYEISKKLGIKGLTGLKKGVYRFKDHELADKQREDSLFFILLYQNELKNKGDHDES